MAEPLPRLSEKAVDRSRGTPDLRWRGGASVGSPEIGLVEWLGPPHAGERPACRAQQVQNCEFAVSAIVDARKVEDLPELARVVRDVVAGVNGHMDYVLIRPCFRYDRSDPAPPADVLERMRDLTEVCVRPILAEAGITVHTAAWKAQSFQREYSRCVGSGAHVALAPSGEVYVCTERNGDPSARLGDLMTEGFEGIWHGERRHQVLSDCSGCPNAPCRGHRLNQTLTAAAELRTSGQQDVLGHWANAVRDQGLQHPSSPRIRPFLL